MVVMPVLRIAIVAALTASRSPHHDEFVYQYGTCAVGFVSPVLPDVVRHRGFQVVVGYHGSIIRIDYNHHHSNIVVVVVVRVAVVDLGRRNVVVDHGDDDSGGGVLHQR